ncbi:uncharacterized protein PRCAT00002377001 [Priceomyces carsonii]|uniref:uncharacterized protein n=1 Tax=Priceomyces carsonii TaxID=28549 RepID=UPI002ED7BC56|nr:unnamed protein product [Priceomyces carsonii]
MSNEDPYHLLTKSIRTLNAPLTTLLRNHDELVLQSVSLMENISSILRFKNTLENGITKNDFDNKSSYKPN